MSVAVALISLHDGCAAGCEIGGNQTGIRYGESMQPLIWDRRPDGLRAPALVCAFRGWNDAGDAASAAVSFMASSYGAERFAQIDPEEYYDFQSTRPRIRLVEGRTRE